MSTTRELSPINRTPAISSTPSDKNRALATALGAGNRSKTDNSFTINTNPKSEHTNLNDFAPKTAVFHPILASVRPPRTIPSPTHLHPTPNRHIIKPLIQLEGTTCARWR
jgi:hypothetical protein